MKTTEREQIKEILIATDLELLPEVTSKNSGRLMEKFEEWFRESPKWFDKHCEPRKDQTNLNGLSLVEELGLGRKAIKNALKPICKHYETVEEYLKATDKFQGHYYCSYLDIKNHKRTRYLRNDSLVNSNLDALLERLLESTDSNNGCGLTLEMPMAK